MLDLESFCRYPKEIAICDNENTWSFSTLKEQIDRRADRFRTRGVKARSIVPFTATTDMDSILNFFALLSLEATPFPLNPRLPPLKIEQLPKDISLPPLATLLLTSGTTSSPKIAAHTLDNYCISASSAVDALKLAPEDRLHLSLPLYHVSGLSILFRSLVSGATIVLSQDTLPLATHYSLVPTQLFRILQDPLKLEHYKKARCILVGGGPMTLALYAEAKASGLPLYTTWGMTETTAMATLGLPSPDLYQNYLKNRDFDKEALHNFDPEEATIAERQGASEDRNYEVKPTQPKTDSSSSFGIHAGRPLSHIEIALSDEGEIKVRGPSLFLGYLEDGRIKSPLDSSGWYATRDLGFIDPKGNLHIKGRKDLLFISGGENIQPEEIEKILGEIPGILEAVVVPAENPEFGALPAAFIRTTHSSSFDADALCEALRPLLPSFKIPRRFFPFPPAESLKNDRSFLSRFATQNF